MSRDSLLTVKQVLIAIGDPNDPDKPLSRDTWEKWRARKRTPRCLKLPNGQLRIRESELNRWLASCEERAA